MRFLMGPILAGGFLVAAGCSQKPSDLLPITGTVTMNKTPLPGATVTFQPVGDTPGQGGHGTTDAEGKYEVAGRDGKGLPPGTYKVTISRMLRKDGTPPPPDVSPIESDARETLPPTYSDPDRTTLGKTVGAAEKTINFDLTNRK
jgi:Carboxypeptidase regulatory-like domain